MDAGRREKARETPPASDRGCETSGAPEGPEITITVFSLVRTTIRVSCPPMTEFVRIFPMGHVGPVAYGHINFRGAYAFVSIGTRRES
jgi:hypothetical protein